MIGLVRESGGIGDIICTGAAARALKEEQPGEEVVSFIPEEFVEVASHLEGIDKVVSLGSLANLQSVRRRRDTEMNPDLHSYLAPLKKYPEARLVDQFCPPYLHESSQSGSLEFNRCQLFAMAAGVRRVQDACPVWNVSPFEEGWAEGWIQAHTNLKKGDLVAVQLRATCAARSLRQEVASELASGLASFCSPVYFDCVRLQFQTAGAAEGIGLSVPKVAAIVKECRLVIGVDSFLLHLAAALSVPSVGIFGPTSGETFARTYPMCTPLDGQGVECQGACNYSEKKHWSRQCRKMGCERMLSHGAGSILDTVKAVFRRYSESQTKSTEVQKG